jgi:L-ascorbate metabolism protein UlaG (beta-lactamase superfamily)
MKQIYWIIGILIIILVLIFVLIKGTPGSDQTNTASSTPISTTENPPVQITPIMHATAILQWSGTTIYTDPTGGATAFQGKSQANIILVTDIHGDHLSTSTLNAVIGSSTLIVPQAVKDMLPANLRSRAKVLKNSETITEQGFQITGVPMYNLPEATSSPHVKGRGNGYLIEKDGYRVYIAGDTEGIPEMRTLTDIDMAFIPMNLPYTMSVEDAAAAVLAFRPKLVYPYHYRGQDGLSDVNKFKQLVNAGDPDIDVVLLNWYPQQ